MSKEIVDALVEGGKATAGPPIGSSLGPLKVNVGEIVSKINEKTKEFKGMKVPVKITVDSETKKFEIEVGTPPVSQLIKKEIGLEKGSGEPNKTKVGVLAFEQVIKVAKMKRDSLNVKTLKAAVRSVVGSCVSSGILIDGKDPKIISKEIEEGIYDELIKAEKTEVSEEKDKQLAELRKEVEIQRKEMEKRKEAEKAAAATAEKAKEEAGSAAPSAAAAAKPAGKVAPIKEKK